MAKNLKFKPTVKDRLFYDRWQYSISFLLDEVSCLRELDHAYIDLMLDRRREWREISRMRLAKLPGQTPFGGTIMSRRSKEITKETAVNLHYLADQLLNTKTDFKLVTSVNQAWVYTNSKTLIGDLADNSNLKYKQFHEAVVDRPKNSVRLKESKYTHRTYFKPKKLTAKEKESISNFFITQQNNIRLSPAAEGWMLTPLLRTQDYFFIDHTGDSWLVMLALICPGLFRKTVDIVTS